MNSVAMFFRGFASRLAQSYPALTTAVRLCAPTLVILLVSSSVVWIGMAFGIAVIDRDPTSRAPVPRLLTSIVNWDANWYRGIVNDGYSFDPRRQTTAAFFPGFPLLAWLVGRTLNLSPEAALPLVSNVALAAALFVFQWYSRSKVNDAGDADAQWSRIALCIWPTGFFLRAGYSESLFLMLALLAMLGIRRNWPCWIVAAIAGAATGVRSVGVALLLPLAWSWWQRSKSNTGLIFSAIAYGPLACWGLLAFMAHLDHRFDDPFAFVKAQKNWSSLPAVDWPQNLLNLLTLEPIRTVYDPSAEAMWRKHDQESNPLFSMQFFNPIYFVTCAGLVAYGVRKRWLTPPEWLLSAGLLGIPYVMQSHRMMMTAHGRFTCVIFPMFIVLGRLLARAPASVQAGVTIVLGFQLFQWAAMYAALHRVF